MSTKLQDLLAEKPVLFADGGMGTGLFALGLETGEGPELWNVSNPEKVKAVHRGFVEAGADIILTNTFGANARRLVLHDAQSRVHELNVAGARIAREAAEEAGRPVIVAGSMGPTGDLFEPLGPLTIDEGAAVFAEQAKALAEGGVDVLWIETMSAADEVTAAIRGAAVAGLPVVATMTFDTNGRTMMGLTPEAAIGHAHGCAVHPLAFGANCGIGPSQLVESLLGLARAADGADVLVAKGNCGIPRYKEGAIFYDGTPDIMAEYAVLARDAGARIVGGCCGTTPDHIRAMVAAVTTRPKGPAPDLATVERVLGPLAPPPKLESEGREGRRRRRG
jgi:5-methyltetrahydrofolate--homocysteine methyltransferase